MESIVQEAKKEERGTQFIEERLLALEKKVEEIAQTVKELSSEITTLKQPQPQATTRVQAINEPKAFESKQNEEERFVLTKTGAIEKKKVKKTAYIEAHP